MNLTYRETRNVTALLSLDGHQNKMAANSQLFRQIVESEINKFCHIKLKIHFILCFRIDTEGTLHLIW